LSHIKISSIELFADILDREARDGQDARTLAFRKKIKIHGQNGCIRIEPDGAVAFQAKNSDVTIEDDIKSFAADMQSQKAAWAGAATDTVLTFFGEWAGPKIAKGTAVQRTDKKRFYIFNVGVGRVLDPRRPGVMIPEWVITDPDAIEAMLPEDLDRDLIRVLPYEGAPIEINFASSDSIEHALDELNAQVDRLDLEDPYFQREFGIKAPGEGYVLSLHASRAGQLSGNEVSRTSFKAKTQKHRVQKQKKAAQPRGEMPKTVLEFTRIFVTPARVDQAIEEVAGGQAQKKHIGQILSWIAGDVKKEGGVEIEALGEDARHLSAAIIQAAKPMILDQIK
jgi:hypothetical protein